MNYFFLLTINKIENMGSTAYAKVDAALAASPNDVAFRNGGSSASSYQKWVEAEGSKIIHSLNEDQINLSARFPTTLYDEPCHNVEPSTSSIATSTMPRR